MATQLYNIREEIISSEWVNLLTDGSSDIEGIFSSYTGSYFYIYGPESEPYLALLDAPFEFTLEGLTMSFPEPGLYVLCNPNELEDYHNFTFEMPKVQINSNYKSYFLPEPPYDGRTHTLKANDNGVYWA